MLWTCIFRGIQWTTSCHIVSYLIQEWGLLKKIYLYSLNYCRHHRRPFEHFQIEMLVCFFADSFRVRFSNFVSLWCFSLQFRGGRSATTGLTFIPCPHWVLRPHLNCLTLWGCLSETFSAQKPQMATFTTCWLVPIFVKSRSPVGSVLMYSAERGANCSRLRFSSTVSSMEIVNKQRGTYEQFLGRNFIGLIALGIEIRGAWVIYT